MKKWDTETTKADTAEEEAEADGAAGGEGTAGPAARHPAICSDCGKECEVPFKPAEGRPVYCRDCFPKHRKY